MSVALSPRDHRVLYALHFLAGDDGKVTVSQRDLGTALGWKRHTGIRSSVIVLERLGLIHVHRNWRPQDRQPNTFTITALGHLVAEMSNARAAA